MDVPVGLACRATRDSRRERSRSPHSAPLPRRISADSMRKHGLKTGFVPDPRVLDSRFAEGLR